MLSEKQFAEIAKAIKEIMAAEYCSILLRPEYESGCKYSPELHLSWKLPSSIDSIDDVYKVKNMLNDISDKMSIGKIQELKNEIKLLNETIEEQKYKIIDLERYKTYVDIVKEINYNSMNNWNAPNNCNIKINKI